MSDNIRKLADDELDAVSGGVLGPSYTPDLLSNSGVSVKKADKSIYYAKLSSGKQIQINETVAKNMCQCYKISGGIPLTDQQILDLIEQSNG
ncbi:MAG: hypothetical protein K6F86_01850 [Lachnospiraceae bacterium]|nr:hypothetical protein [Lachnospiraceae bacterium]